MTRPRIVLILFLALWAAAVSPGVADADNMESRLYDMTAAETEEVVLEWLKSHGFEVFHQSQSDQFVELLIEKKYQRIRIVIQRHSPIAARVRIEAAMGDAQPAAQALWRYLDGYINLPNHPSDDRIDTIPDFVRSHHKAVVCLYAAGDHKEIQITGFAVDTDGLIICTGHDLETGEQVSVFLSDGREIYGRVVKIDRLRDLALIQTSVKLDFVVPLRNGRFMLQNGDRLFAITCPNGSISSIEPGFLDGPPRRVQGMPLWQVQMHINHGSSGSPVFDSQGRMAAIVKGRFRGTNSIGFLIPFESILQFLEKY